MSDDYESSTDTSTDVSSDTTDSSSDVDTSTDISDTSSGVTEDCDMGDDGSSELPDTTSDDTDVDVTTDDSENIEDSPDSIEDGETDSSLGDDTGEDMEEIKDTTDNAIDDKTETYDDLADNAESETEHLDESEELRETVDNSIDSSNGESEISDSQNFEKLDNDGADNLPDTTETTENLSNDSINSSAVSDTNDNINASSNFNGNPSSDIETAFNYADSRYPRDSATWQENANRYIDSNQSKINELKPQYEQLMSERDSLDKQLTQYIHDNNMSMESCETDSVYQDLLRQRMDVNQQCESLGGQIGGYQSKIDGITGDINPEMKTTFSGFNGSDFDNAYNGYITQRQGHAYSDVQGCCGVDGSVSKINQQTGKNLTEKDGIDQCVANKWCDYNKNADPGENGGTNYKDRTNFLNSHGLSNDRVDGAYKGQGQGITLSDMENRFRNGESCDLMLKAEDLSQPELSSRKMTFSDWRNNIDPKSANHATTVAGFSYDKDGNVAGVWLNDTGGWANGNRVYLDSAKFNDMQYKTKGFAVEYSKKEDNR